LRLFLLILLFTLGLAGTFYSCTKTATGTPGPTGPQGPAGANAIDTPNAITGYVNLINQYGITESTFAGVSVSTRSGDSVVNSATDPTGSFKLPGLVIGNYDLTFRKSGFDSLMVHVENSGGDEDKFIGILRMNEQVTTNILSETVSLVQGADYPYDSIFTVQMLINIDGPPLSPTTRRDFGFYFSRSRLVNSDQYDLLAYTYGYSLSSSNNSYTYQYDLLNFINRGLGYHSGDTIFIKTYVLPVNNISTWFNYTSYQTINYPYLGDSTLNFFVWP
jgi:hypothetical protein